MTVDDIAEQEIRELLSRTEPFAGLDDELLRQLAARFVTVNLDPDEILFRRGEPSDSFFIVVSGRLAVRSDWRVAEKTIAEAGPGELVGSITMDNIRTRSASLIALETSTLLKLGKAAFDAIRGEFPEQTQRITATMAERSNRLRLGAVMRANPTFAELPPAVMEQLEQAIEIIAVHSGDILWRENDPSDCLYIVINGRLRIWQSAPTAHVSGLKNEISPGESVGELGAITNEPRAAELRAIRDSTIAKLTQDRLLQLLRDHPEVVNRVFVKVIARHMSQGRDQVEHGKNASNTVALVPIRKGRPVGDVGHWLGQALAADAARCDQALGLDGFAQSTMGDPRTDSFLNWLNDVEYNHHHIIFVADDRASNWTSRCIRQADHILFVADTNDNPDIGDVEAEVLRRENLLGVRKTLLLLHSGETAVADNSLAWLAPRKVGNHHHLRQGNIADFECLARFLTGGAVGVVLGGGGARGFAHVGVLKALEEANIPIDLVGGTSMGALIAAQYAMQKTPDDILRDTLALCLAGDRFTIPLVSLYEGAKFAKGLRRMFGAFYIEDLWRRFYSVSCNLSRARIMIHADGALADAVMASNTPPGLFPAKVQNGDLLVDGALLNNVPIDIMGRYNEGGMSIAVDVNPKDDLLANSDYIDGLSGWRVLRDKLLPWRQTMQVPNIIDVLMRATAIGGLAQQKQAMAGAANLYLQPPVSEYLLMGYANAEKIAEAGYQYTKIEIKKWRGANRGLQDATEPAANRESANQVRL